MARVIRWINCANKRRLLIGSPVSVSLLQNRSGDDHRIGDTRADHGATLQCRKREKHERRKSQQKVSKLLFRLPDDDDNTTCTVRMAPKWTGDDVDAILLCAIPSKETKDEREISSREEIRTKSCTVILKNQPPRRQPRNARSLIAQRTHVE